MLNNVGVDRFTAIKNNSYNIVPILFLLVCFSIKVTEGLFIKKEDFEDEIFSNDKPVQRNKFKN